MPTKLLGLLMTLVLMACATPKGEASRESMQLRVLSYNIHHGEGTDGKLDLARIAGVIKSINPDLVALQEVDQNTTRTLGVDQAAELGKLVGIKHHFGKAMDFQGGGYGQVILSRFPMSDARTHLLPQETNREPRILVTAKIELPGGETIHFGGTHLDHQRNDIRLEQAQAIQKIFSEIPGRAIVAGDFNANPESEPMREMFRGWGDAAVANPQPTIPSGAPRQRIDYILYRPAGEWKVLESKVLDEAVASDHRPVYGALTVPSSGRP